MTIARVAFVALAAMLAASPAAEAQKGTGAPDGVARQAAEPAVQRMSGTVTAVGVGACEATTGRATEGAHLIVRADDGRTINLHLGPADAVGDVVAKAPAGTTIAFDAFRTPALPDDAYVARSITVGGEVFELRDDALRPRWAIGGRRGGGTGPGRGMGRGPCR